MHGSVTAPKHFCSDLKMEYLLDFKCLVMDWTSIFSSEKQNQILVLTKKLRVADERVNFQNQKLIDTYNEVWKAGDLYLETIKGGKNKPIIRNMEKNFLGLVSNLKTYRAAVLEAGGEPIKFPVHVFQKLPKYFQDALKEEKIA